MRFVTWNEKLGKSDCPYLVRWALNFHKFSIRVHHWYRSDDKRAMHDHPWWFYTLILKGAYEDWTQGDICIQCKGAGKCEACDGRGFELQRELMTRGKVSFRPALHKHTVNILPGGCWTLILTGKVVRPWGFYVRKASGKWKFKKANKFFLEHGHHPCDQL